MRTYLLSAVVAVLALYAWRDWFKSLCGLILLTAVMEHPDMPKSIAGIQGFNPWNVVLLSVLAAWLVARRREGLRWDMPRSINLLLGLYLLVVLVGFARMIADRTHLEQYSTTTLISEYLANSLKWVVPGLLLFDGCRTRRRLGLAVGCTVALYVVLALLVLRCTSVSALLGRGNLEASRHRIQKRTGYNAVNVAAMLAGASWGLLALRPVLSRRWQQVALVAIALGVIVAQGLTGGRMGYVAWGAVGLTMCALRWRRYLFFAPLIPVLLVFVFPGATQRMLKGFGQSGLSGESEADEYQVTSGRAEVWPHVLDEIQEAPIWGHGQLAMLRTGLRARLPEVVGQTFAHPHNAYLEVLLDYGLVGLTVILAFFAMILVWAARLFVDRGNPWCTAVGGLALALVLGQLVASLGSQHFYPREGVVGMWLAIGLMLRVGLLRERAHRAAAVSVPQQPVSVAAAWRTGYLHG